MSDKKPTEEGINRYPPDGVYEGFACTCKPECPLSCKGQCGCDACCAAYSDFLSTE